MILINMMMKLIYNLHHINIIFQNKQMKYLNKQFIKHKLKIFNILQGLYFIKLKTKLIILYLAQIKIHNS